MGERILKKDAEEQHEKLEKDFPSYLKDNGGKLMDLDIARDSGWWSSDQTREDYAKESLEVFGKLKEMVQKDQELTQAILRSDATTVVKTHDGRELTVAEALKVLSAMSDPQCWWLNDPSGTDFKGKLLHRMKQQYDEFQAEAQRLNDEAIRERAAYKSDYVKNSSGTGMTEEAVRMLEELPDTYVPVDPLNLAQKLEEMEASYHREKLDLELAISLSNATTYIEIPE